MICNFVLILCILFSVHIDSYKKCIVTIAIFDF